MTLSILAPLWKSTYALDENFKVVRNDEGAGEVLTKMEFDTEKLEEMKIEHFVTSTSLGKDGASADSIYSTPAIPVCK